MFAVRMYCICFVDLQNESLMRFGMPLKYMAGGAAGEILSAM